MIGPKMILAESSSLIKTFFRQRSTIIWVIIVPIILCLTCTSIISAVNENEISVFVLDKDDTQVSRDLVDGIREHITVIEIDDDGYITETEALQKMKDSGIESAGLIVIPQGFRDDWYSPMLTEKHGKVMLYYEDQGVEVDIKSTAGPSEPGEPRLYINQFKYTTLAQDMFGNSNLYTNLAPGIVLGIMCEILLGLIIGSRTSMRERGVTSMVKSTGLKWWHTIAGNMLWALIPSATVCAISYVILNLYSRVKIDPSILLILVLSSLCITSIGMVLSVLVRESQGSSIIASAILLPMLMLSGAVIPISAFPEFFAKASYISPMTYMVCGFKDSLGLSTPIDYGACVGGIVVVTVIFTIIWALLNRSRLCR